MTFTPEVYEEIREGARRSAAIIAPLAFQLFAPKTVADVGCGEGAFSEAFASLGCLVDALDESVDGVRFVSEPEWGDGDEMGAVTYRHADLAGGDAWAYEIAKLREDGSDLRPTVGESGFPFDLVVCLEVAEHLPPGAADAFAYTLCDLAPVVLFSAAVPGQGGHGHLNEQWPAFWAERFRTRGRLVSGGLRWHLWESGVEPWYAQNLLVAATDVAAADVADRVELLGGGAPAWADWLFDARPENEPLPVVHPTTFSYWVEIAKARR